MIKRILNFYPSTAFMLTAYALLSGVWIIGGDLLLANLAGSPEQLHRWQTFKGLGFAILSAGTLALFALQRDRNENELKVSETHYRTLFYGSLSPKLLIDAQTGEILDANPAALDFYGYSYTEITALRTSDLTSLNEEELALAMQHVRSSQQERFEDVHRLKDGTHRRVEVNSGPVELQGRKLLYAIVHDVTERQRSEEALRVRSAALAAAPHGIVITDLEGRIEWVNPAFTQMTGYTSSEVIGDTPGVIGFGLGDDPKRLAAFFQTVAAGEEWREEKQNRRKDGSSYPEELTVTPVRDDFGEIRNFVAIKQDVTEKKKTQLELQKRARQQQVLAKLSQTALLDTGLTDLMEQAVSAVADVLSVSFVNVLQLDAKQETFTLWAGFGWPEDLVGKLTVPNSPETQAGFVLRNAEPVTSADLQEETRFTPSAILLKHGGKSSVALAIDYGRETYGVLAAHDSTTREFPPTEVTFLQGVANVLAAAIRQQNYARQIEISNQQLLEAYDATIEGWAHTLDLRDHETEGHSRRVSNLSTRLGQALGLGEDELLSLRRGALLHDIGKMGVPDSILHKPGALTDDEWRVMQSHTTLARKLLSRVSFLHDAVDVPYSHHEKWDGSGYPQGLKGQEIPLAARIFAVVDVYDALTSDRPYRKAWDEKRVLEHIRSEAGTHFDPHVTEKFLELMQGPTKPLDT